MRRVKRICPAIVLDKSQLVIVILLLFFHGPMRGIGQQASEQVFSANWTLLETNSPTMRSGYAMAYDTLHRKIIAYGGRTGFPYFRNVNETWAFDFESNKWENLKPAKSPPWRSSHTMIYDPAEHRTLMFGGSDFRKAYNDLWEYSYSDNTWRELSPQNPPPVRQMHGMTYIADRNVSVLFGGRKNSGGASFNDLWLYHHSNNEWEQLKTSNKPSYQDHVAMAYHESAKKLILFADIENNSKAETWAFDLTKNRWTNLNSVNAPPGEHCKLVYDPHRKLMVMFGGSMDGSNTWIFDYNGNSWIDISPKRFPEINFTSFDVIEHDALVYLNESKVFIQYGGCCSESTLKLIINK